MKVLKVAPLLMALVYLQVVSADELTSIEVESSVLSNTVTENRFPSSVILGDDISAAKSIGSNLRYIPGVSNSDYGEAIGQPVIRGLGGSRVRVLSNNNYVSDLSFFSADHPVMINLDHVSHIEVIKGPSSLFNYSGTTGGIVNVITGSSTDKLYDDERISFGRSYDTVSEGYSNNFLMKKNFSDVAVYIAQSQKFHFKYDLPEGSLYEDGAEVHTLNNSDLADKSSTIGLSIIKDWGYFNFSVFNHFQNLR